MASSQSSSVPTYLFGSFVDRLNVNSSNPNARSTDSTKSSSEAISSGACSGVQKMWLSSCVKPRIRISPCSVPARS